MKWCMEIKNVHNNLTLTIGVANTFLERLQGLMGKKSLPVNRGLMLVHCNAIHMCFMRFPLDIVYIDKEYCIVKMVQNLRPWHLSWCRIAEHTLEFPVGTIARQGWSKKFILDIQRKDEY